MRTRRTATLPALLLLLAGGLGCGVTLPWESGSAPDAPGVQVQAGGSDAIYVSWTLQPGVDGYELQARVGAGPWGPAPGYQIGPNAWFAPFGDVAELGTMGFRLRAVAGAHVSGWVEGIAVRPLLRPTLVTVDTNGWGMFATGPATVRWTNASLVATDVLVERGPGSGLGPWTVLPGATLAAGTLVDRDLQDGASYVYRVRVGKAGVWSEATIAYAGPIALAAPWGLEAKKVASGVALTWHAQSTTATNTSIYRSNDGGTWGSPVAGLSGAPSAWLDVTPALWPATSYRVSVNGNGTWAYSDWAVLEPFNIAGPPALAASTVELPAATRVARAPDGSFQLLDASWYGGTAYRPTGSGWEAHSIAGPAYTSVTFLSPGIASDAAGAPHLVYVRTNGTTNLRDLVHEAWNGTAWDADVLESGTAVSSDAYPTFAVVPGGALHVAYVGPWSVDSRWGVDSRPVVHLVREGGVTTATTIDPEPTTSFVTLSLAMQSGDDGTVVLAREGYAYTADGSPIELSTRTPAGSWSLDPVPIGSTGLTSFSLAVGHGGDVAIAYVRPSYGPSYQEEIRVVRRTGGVWSAPELVFSRPWTGGSDVTAVAVTPDLSRIALLIWANYTSWIAMRGSAGWDVVQVGPTQAAGWLGFGASGFWALYRNDIFSATPTLRYSAFADAP